jgi:hypothetical protein
MIDQMNGWNVSEENDPIYEIEVAVMTSDYAMQVLNC